ncbi:hypothetical protein M3Y99_00466800 [Aphelenchoides fujianensis]|nr:hypothetical protein M3Y99_00466800 [Aphelenchoides fujianensis]
MPDKEEEHERAQYVCCLGHLFRAVFIASLITIVINAAHVIIAARHQEWLQLIAPGVSILCYLFIIAALGAYIHYFFWPEFFLNIIALPVKIVLAVWLMINAIDDLETKMDEPANEVTKDVIHTLRAIFILMGVVLELLVFRLCMQAHHLMQHLPMAEGKRHFSIVRFVCAKDVLPPESKQELEALPEPIAKIKEKLEDVAEALHV